MKSIDGIPYSFGIGLYLHDSGLTIKEILVGAYSNIHSAQFDNGGTLKLNYGLNPPYFESAEVLVRNYFHYLLEGWRVEKYTL